MISMSTFIQSCLTIICAVVSGIILWKVQKNQKVNEKRHAEQVELAIKERELLVATSKTAELLARKIDGEGINGELHKANEETKIKRKKLQDFTVEKFFDITIE